MTAPANKQTTFIDLGLMPYDEAWAYQTRLFEEILEIKKSNRDKTEGEAQPTPNYLIFCEHPHVYTLGKSGKEENLLLPLEQLRTRGATYHRINRGGDITYHGPGQLVAYPVMDLENFFTDIHRYMRTLEEAVIQTVRHFGLNATRVPGLTGVWLQNPDRKICALGVKTSRWVTMHGLALNVNTDLSYFEHIVPCGIDDKTVTSMQHELQRPVPMEEVNKVLRAQLFHLFGMTS
ncbi:MAG: lipoyl(octanoyl) transferase LipB [Cyclobacteriaceae bacterium]|jgi:lipoyl(octanoyl) transferase|nr:lipoyl(octanoyl) transferase LipB [Cyclobacteriaceae bacterium]